MNVQTKPVRNVRIRVVIDKMAKAASSDELRQGFEEHLEQTKVHEQRLEEIF